MFVQCVGDEEFSFKRSYFRTSRTWRLSVIKKGANRFPPIFVIPAKVSFYGIKEGSSSRHVFSVSAGHKSHSLVTGGGGGCKNGVTKLCTKEVFPTQALWPPFISC